ncbi:TipAS antibiotic-recognition domain-containing protein [Nocardiopsis changdeensis]|uniref:TipAS antibiotic-recognition domain-containing protein n=1 Tax=Nocardiopsis changdeensis TaxID=2831969 RepID=A0ABX8BGA5_9ACTN|nr:MULTISPECIES: TipAS antibiotic-recognition domain-containing protein [Nocardiopsis]QUX21176.1 TipAS antibiotic-recognition domain-containing protein [Nocardiopsis changdeensis]QYX37106.1 TipAS antibiotic-recognition domain-containing protein [Nocardiopsis sp. MT53]
MTRREAGSPLSDDDKREVWGGFADREEEYLDEVEHRWGGTEAYADSARRVAGYGRAEWERINRDNAAIEARIRELMAAGADPRGTEAMDVAEASRLHVSRWFYAMDHGFHVAKSELYVQDERYRQGIEENTAPGAAEWLRAAIVANAERARLRERARERG